MVWADFMVGQSDVTQSRGRGAFGGAGAWGELGPPMDGPGLMVLLWGESCIKGRWMQKAFAGEGEISPKLFHKLFFPTLRLKPIQRSCPPWRRLLKGRP